MLDCKCIGGDCALYADNPYIQHARGLTFLPRSALSWNFSLAENLASLSLQDRATKWYYYQANPPHQISSFAGLISSFAGQQLDLETRLIYYYVTANNFFYIYFFLRSSSFF